MDSIKSTTSLSRRHGHGVDSVDRISDLPIWILSHILSFLPTKDAVATHILSKRWNLVWTTVSHLDFRYPDHCTEDQYRKSSGFVDFVNHVLLLHKPACLDKLSLTFEAKSIHFMVEARIYSWISAAVLAKNARELFVSFKNTSFRPPFQMQSTMFSCEGLQSLELKGNICISSEIMVSLPGLERLILSSVDFQNEEAFSKLLDGCPVLKYLFIDLDRVNTAALKCIISSTSLRHLELYARYKCPLKALMYPYRIQLDAPSLEYIKLQAEVSSIFIQQRRLTSLVEANIQLEILGRNSNYVVEVIRAFDCAKNLTLSAQVMQDLSRATIKIGTKFKRLTRLEVTIDWLNHWSSLQDLISLSDNLEILTLKKGYGTREDFHTDSYWKEPSIVPTCLSNSLRIVYVGAYYGHQNTLAMVSYILKHGSVLQVMKICFDESISDFKTKFDMVQKISKFPRKSLDCEVEFC